MSAYNTSNSVLEEVNTITDPKYFYCKAMENRDNIVLYSMYMLHAHNLGCSDTLPKLREVFINHKNEVYTNSNIIEFIKKTSELGYAGSLNEMGYCYNNGFGVEREWTKAVEYYTKAADKNNPVAMCNLAGIYIHYQITSRFGDAKQLLEKSISMFSFSQAYNNLGLMYARGMGVMQDVHKALEYYTKAEELGSCKAINYNLGCLYLIPATELFDLSKARYYFTKAVQLGCTRAEEMLKILGLEMAV